MTEKQFRYAASCNRMDMGKCNKFLEENQKEEYTCDDWIACFYSESEPIKTGSDRPLMSPMSVNGTYCYTTRQWS